MNLPRWLLISLVLIISGVWVTSFVAGLIVETYNPPESINLVFSAMVAAVLAQLSRQDARRREEGEDNDGS